MNLLDKLYEWFGGNTGNPGPGQRGYVPPNSGLPGGGGVLPEQYVDVINIILNLFGISFPTHRPNSDELPDGTQWYNGTPDAGVVRMWRHNGGESQWRWKGEILATAETNFPVGCWDYARQTFDPIIAIDPNGCCIFMDKNEFNDHIDNPESFLIDIAHNTHPSHDYSATWQEIGDFRSIRDAYNNRYIAEDIRNQSWAEMGLEAQRFYNTAAAHNIPFCYVPPGDKISGIIKSDKMKTTAKVTGGIIGTAAAALGIVKLVKR